MTVETWSSILRERFMALTECLIELCYGSMYRRDRAVEVAEKAEQVERFEQVQ